VLWELVPPSLIGIINVVEIILGPLWEERGGGINNARGSRKSHSSQYFKILRLKIPQLNQQCDEVGPIPYPIWGEMHNLSLNLLPFT
jgi:hypothetical protein